MRRIAKKQCIQQKLNSYWWNVASPTHSENIGELRKSIYTLAGEFPCNTDLRKKGTWSGNKKAGSPQPQTLCFPLFLRQLHLFRQRANNVVLQPRVQTPSGVLCTEKHVYICKHHQSQLIECSFWSADHLGSLYGPWWQSFKKKGKTSQLKGE